MDYLSAKFGDFSFSRFGFIVRSGQRDSVSNQMKSVLAVQVGNKLTA